MEKEIIKILAINNKNSGSHFHRIDYPFSKINGTELDNRVFDITLKEFTPEVVAEAENYNIFVYNWDVNVSVQELGRLQAKGVKILYSIDDFWQFSDTHPYYNNPMVIQVTQNRVLQSLTLADAVMVTTERLAMRVLPYNTNVAIIPNFLDPNDYKLEKEPSDKLRVGILGSISHLPDWRLLKGAINRIAKNKELAEKCEFYVCGYAETDRNWQEILKLFTVKKNLTVIPKAGLPVEEYMTLYNNLDVCLMPLELTEFNVCKSALKLMECTISKTIPVGSVLYNAKELKGIVVAETPMDYEETLVELLNKESYNQVLEHITKTNLEDADFEKRLHNTKAVFSALYTDDLSVKIDDLEIHSIVYDKDQVTEYTPYDNSSIRTLEQKSWRFEYNPIIDIVSRDNNKDYIGIFSWKFPNKTGIIKNILYKTLLHKKYNEYDFISLSRSYWSTTKDYLNFSYQHHPKLEVLLKRVLEHLNKPYEFAKENYVYSNFFIMKKENWVDYVENWVKPALEFMENDPEYSENANYTSGLPADKLKELTGLDHYTYHTFVLERLIVFYVHQKQLSILKLV